MPLLDWIEVFFLFFLFFGQKISNPLYIHMYLYIHSRLHATNWDNLFVAWWLVHVPFHRSMVEGPRWRKKGGGGLAGLHRTYNMRKRDRIIMIAGDICLNDII